MRGVAKVDLEGLKSDYTRAREWTARFVRQFDDKDMDLRPGEGSMPTRDQIKQIRQSDEFVLSLLNDDTPNPGVMKNEFNTDTVASSITALKDGLDKVLEAINGCNPDRLQEKVTPFGPEWEMTRGQWLYLMIDHESHHRGQLVVYLRIAGKTPAVIWEPVNESVFEL
jgi:uncharacterized damage-inducible protein DinB